MKIYSISLIALLFLSVECFPRAIDLQQAEKVAINFFYERINQYETVRFDEIKAVSHFIEWDGNHPLLYIFNLNHPGFVIVSGSNLAYPVLAYSFEGTYSNTGVPIQLQGLIKSYRLQVSYAIHHPFQPESFIVDEWSRLLSDDAAALRVFKDEKDIEPMLNTAWDQGIFYNEMCPADPGGPGGHCVTGCVATAMGQLVNYFRWPDTGEGSYSYTWSPYGTLFADFGNTAYRWNEMATALNHSNLAVAEILSHLGISVDMEYGPTSSGMTNHKAAYSLRTFFKYSPETQYVYRDSTSLDWDSLLVTHLDKHIPMYYAGWSDPWTSGHAFICDGYQGDHHYHFNWGWGGSYDGYFYTDNLNPGGSNFNNAQELIINGFPDTVLYQYPYLCQGIDTLNTIDGTIDDGSGPVYDYANNASCGWLIAPEDSVNNISISFLKFETEANDILTIYDGGSAAAPVLGTFSGSGLPSDVISTADRVFITFETDAGSTAPGWLLSFASEVPVYCSGQVTLGSYPADTFSDGSGPRDYHNSSQCIWRIEPEGAGTVSLFFDHFKTEENNDKVKVYDLVTQELLGEFSGDLGSPGLVATSLSGKMFMTFTTNTTVTDEGWDAYYFADWVGVDEIPANIKIEVFPIPVRDKLNVSIQHADPGTVRLSLISVNGTTMMKKEYAGIKNNGVFTMNTASLPDGIYILKIELDKETKYRKIVIQQ